MFKITIEGETISDIKAQVAELHASMEYQAPRDADIDIDPVEIKSQLEMDLSVEAEPQKEKKPGKKSRKAKAKKNDDEDFAPEVNDDAPTIKDVHEILQQVNASLGLPAARNILQKFDAQRISQLTEDKYAGFISECNEVLAQA